MVSRSTKWSRMTRRSRPASTARASSPGRTRRAPGSTSATGPAPSGSAARRRRARSAVSGPAQGGGPPPGGYMAGDLIFFNATQHVAMYLGNGLFVHAPHTGDVVRVARLDGLSARRVGLGSLPGRERSRLRRAGRAGHRRARLLGRPGRGCGARHLQPLVGPGSHPARLSALAARRIRSFIYQATGSVVYQTSTQA